MTLEQVMALGNWELNRLVAVKIGAIPDPPEMYWSEEDGRQLPVRGVPIPDYAGDWNAAMLIREWGRVEGRIGDFLDAVQRVVDERVDGWVGPSDSIDYILVFQPIDLARAALLVESR